MMKELWIGWLYGNEEDKKWFESLGVHGPMGYRKCDNSHSSTPAARTKAGIFEHCWADQDTLERLRAEYPAFYDSFSKVTGQDLKIYMREHTRRQGSLK